MLYAASLCVNTSIDVWFVNMFGYLKLEKMEGNCITSENIENA